MNQPGSLVSKAGMLRAWHLAILRFAITRDNGDRLGIFAIANEIDRLDCPHGATTDFSFFRRTSAELCGAILYPNDAGKAILKQYRARIDDERLRLAFAVTADLETRPPVARAKQRSRSVNALWRGLPARGAARG
jgi:hypothetical protein